MPDWNKLIAENLRSCTVPDDVVRELAAHLEEVYEQFRSRGLGEAAAFKITLQEVEHWDVLRKEICRITSEDDIMNRRTKTLWLPGMVTLLGASLSLMIFQQSGTHPSYWTWKGAIVLMFYWHWLAVLPLCGAAGAYLGKQAHAQLGTRVAVATSPALLLLIVMCGILPLEMIADGFSWFRVVYFAVAIVNWVVIPAAALLFGAAPFLRHSRGEAETLFSTSEV